METLGDVALGHSPGRWPSSTRSAARRSSAWPVSLSRRPGASHRLQLALGAAGLLACVAALGFGVRLVRVEPDAAHRVTVGGLHFTYPAMDAAAMSCCSWRRWAPPCSSWRSAPPWRTSAHTGELIRTLPVTGTLADDPAVP